MQYGVFKKAAIEDSDEEERKPVKRDIINEEVTAKKSSKGTLG